MLDNRVAIVTGAGRGIGRSIALHLASLGAKVIVNDLGTSAAGQGANEDPAEATAREITTLGGAAVADGGDISDTATGKALVAKALDNFGGLDIVVNVAGILRDRMIFNMEPEDWDAVIRVHLRGHFSTIAPAATYWRQQRNPDGNFRIINFTSVSGLHGSPGQPNYAAAKMGVVGFTYSLASSLARYGVTANAISPAAATRLTAGIAPGAGDDAAALEAEMSADNVAPIVSYLASDRSGWLTGRTLSSTGYEVALYNNPEPLADVRSEGAWQMDDLAAQVEATFRPLADGLPAGPFTPASA